MVHDKPAEVHTLTSRFVEFQFHSIQSVIIATSRYVFAQDIPEMVWITKQNRCLACQIVPCVVG